MIRNYEQNICQKKKRTKTFSAYIILLFNNSRFDLRSVTSTLSMWSIECAIGQALSVWRIAFDNESEETWRAGAKRDRKEDEEENRRDKKTRLEGIACSWKDREKRRRTGRRCRVQRVVEWGLGGGKVKQGEPAIWLSEPSAAWQHFSTAPWNRSRLSRC